MRSYEFTLGTARLSALPSGALWWPEQGILCVSDLHFGKSARLARRGGSLLPPYENRETLARLERDILKRNPSTLLCLGDSFDDLEAFDEMDEEEHHWLICLMAGRRWIWIAGNHDPGPVELGGSHVAEFAAGGLVFRHMADPDMTGEVSGHYHPKKRVNLKARTITRPCFLLDGKRLILPAYGTFTGGLQSQAPVLTELMARDSIAILTGKVAQPVPMWT